MMCIGFAVLLMILNSVLPPKTAGPESPWLLIYFLLLLLIVPVGAAFYAFSFENRRWQNSSVGGSG